MNKITIETDADFTPAGKRSFRVVQTSRGGYQLRWYVSGRIYRSLAPTPSNMALSRDWAAA
jgi:hypothetical protein